MSYYHETLKQIAGGAAVSLKRGLKSAEMVEHFRLGFSNRTLGYHLPEKNRVAGADQRGRLQELGSLPREADTSTSCGSLVIPILNLDGDVVQMYGRKITTICARTRRITCTCRDRMRGVWNEQALIASKEIILCEALIDALTFWCAGYRNVTTSYGVNGFTDEHREPLSEARHEANLSRLRPRRGRREARPETRGRTDRDGHRVFPGAVSARPGRQRVRAEDSSQRRSRWGCF